MAKTLAALLMTLLAAACGNAQSAPPSVGGLYAEKTLGQIEALDAKLDGVLGVALADLTTGETIEYHAHTVFPTASVIKVPVLVRVMRAVRAGQLRMDQTVTLSARDAVGGRGTLQDQLKRGSVTITLRELIERMIIDSDNTATNAVIRLAGMDAVNATAAELGLRDTRLRRAMMDTAAAREDRENVSSPADLVRLMGQLWRGEAAQKEDCGAILTLMKRVNGAFRATLTVDVDVASKTGELSGVYSETGIVYLERHPFAYAVMTTLLKDDVNPIPAVAAIAYRNFERLSHGNVYGNEVH
jgi:beta-lactamase class A